MSLSSFQTALISRFGAGIFIVAKLLRFGFFLLVVTLVINRTKTLAGYDFNQALVIFMTYNVIDTLAQLVFRDVYRFRWKVVSGDFDLFLVQPFNSLTRVLIGGADPLDLVVLIPYTSLLIYFISQLHFGIVQLLLYILLVVNGLVIATAFHIAVLALGILTTEVDHTIMIYRDIESMARFPIDIYKEPLRGLITFVIPIGIMMTFPPKVLFGVLTTKFLIIALVIGGGFFYLSLWFWKRALQEYTSASS